MRRMKLPAAVFLLLLFFALVFPVRALAAEGWTEENGDRVYIGENGERVTEEWMRGTDNRYCWLDEDGVMAVNTWADGEYYVDAEGHMVKNKWMKLPEPEKTGPDKTGLEKTGLEKEEADISEDTSSEKASSEKVSSEAASAGTASGNAGSGTMPGTRAASGAGNAASGAADIAADAASAAKKPVNMVWYYFGSTGKAVKDGWAKISGRYYYFDEDGVLQKDRTR